MLPTASALLRLPEANSRNRTQAEHAVLVQPFHILFIPSLETCFTDRFIHLISIDSLSLGTRVTRPWSWVSRCFASLRYCEDKGRMPRKGLGKSGPAAHTRGRFVARTQASVSTKMVLLQTDATALCSAPDLRVRHTCTLSGAYAAFIPNLERVTNFLVKNLSAVIHASGAVKKLGTSEKSLKLNQRGHEEE